jgi:glycosyltransferase involved in cell wall biosynthesis
LKGTRLHLIGLFHTIPSQDYSHCAFTGKVLRFSKMMRSFGYEVVEYANEGSESVASEKVAMLRRDEFDSFFAGLKDSEFVGNKASVGTPWHSLFESRLVEELGRRLGPRDIVCHPFGHSHECLLKRFPNNLHVETGIGYSRLMKGSYRIFESYAWMHYHMGKEQRGGSYYEWVIPNYFDLDEWEPSYEPGKYIAFLGRICKSKGMDTIYEIAKHVDTKIVLCGQGDPTPWRHENIEYRGPIKGRYRSEFLRNATCSLMPTQFVEPFGGSGVESMLCGTPLISVDYGAFTETVQDGLSGYRCRLLSQWIDAVRNAGKLDRRLVAEHARKRYSLQACGEMYDRAFGQLMNLYGKGWYTL